MRSKQIQPSVEAFLLRTALRCVMSESIPLTPAGQVRNRGSVNRPKLRSSEPLPYSSAVTPAPTSPPQSVPAQATQPPAGSAPAGDRPGNWVGWGGLSGAQGGLGGVGGGAGWRPIAELTASANQLLDAALAKARGAVKLPDANSPGVDGSLACGLPGFAQAHAQAKAMLDEARRMAEAALMEALARSNGSELNQQKQRLLELELKLSEAEEKLAMMGSMAGTPRSGRSGGGGGGGGSRMSTTPSVLSGYIHRGALTPHCTLCPLIRDTSGQCILSSRARRLLLTLM